MEYNRPYCAYENLPTDGIFVVSMSSAIALCNQDLDPISANHIDIVKPKDRNDVRYTRLAQALRGVLESKPEPTQISQKGNPKSAAFERLQLEILLAWTQHLRKWIASPG
jgi:hypothetical protein